MQIKLNHVGLIKDSTIALDGLTVITGKNNSGKTTVGKTLYALLDAVSNLKRKARLDRDIYIEKQINTVRNILNTDIYCDDVFEDEEIASYLSDYPILYAMLLDNFELEDRQHPEDIAHQLDLELKRIDGVRLIPLQRARVIRRYDEEKQAYYPVKVPPRPFNELQQEALAVLAQLFEDLGKDPELIQYARESVNQTLREEFSGQIQPVKMPDAMSTIELSEWGENAPVYFHFSIVNNGIVDDGGPIFFGVPFKRVYMIDDPFILDAPLAKTRLQGHMKKEFETFFNPVRIQSHNRKLRQAVINAKPVNIFEQMLLNDSLKSIKEQIDNILPGTFEFSTEGEYYIENGAKIKISNLATGSKMFSIIKRLLEGGRLDAGTMLILDEPEAHLHPKWQNVFAEIIVLLVKELKVNVLLTTHSPNFMLALDANMRKHSLNKQTNFYQTDTFEDGFVQYHCTNDDLGQIYDDFLQYLSEMRMLRDRYLYPYSTEENKEESE